MLYFNLNKKNTQIKVNYNLSYRDYKKRVVSESYSYFLNGHKYQSNRTGLNSPLRYQDHSMDISIVHVKDSSYAFQFKFSPTLFHSNTNVRQNIINTVDDVSIEGTEKDSDRYDYFRPTFDIYISKILPQEKELIFDLTGTSYLVNDQTSQLQTDTKGDSLLFDRVNTNSKKYSLIAETMLSKQYQKVKLNYGFRYTQSYQTQKILNSFDNADYNSTTTEQYLYAELIGAIKKMDYQFSLGISNNMFKEQNGENSYTFLTFRPILTGNYNFSDKSQLKFRFAGNPQIPSLSELSSNKYLIDNNIIYAGNPQLDPYNQYHTSLQYFLTLPKFSIDAELHNIFAKNPVSPEYLYKENYIYKTNNNQEPEQLTYGYLVLQLNPFKNQLVQLSLVGGGLRNDNRIKTYGTSYTNIQTFNQIAATLNLHIAQLQVEYRSVYEDLTGQFLSKTENYSAISLFSKGKKWSLALKMYYPLAKSTHYETKTVPSAVVQQQRVSDIYDNGKMLTVNFTYDFDFGKSFIATEKKIKNQDNDSGVLKNE